MEDCCAICAEPLEWTAYGPCGHKDACSKCVVRLRAVLDDQRCVICQSQHPAVIATKFMGAFTMIKPQDYFNSLKAHVKGGELFYLSSARMYFDDKDHFDEMRKLCSFTHPVLQQASSGSKLEAPPVFASLQDLKRHLQQELQLQFCDICLEGRKVFAAEQILYSKQDLDRHKKSGDLTGPLAESGFKGHPLCNCQWCSFCRKRFYGDNEMYTHMQHTHETCFLCRRSRPDKFVYYRDYAELEDHFRGEHHLCEHPSCRESRFVVFGTEADLKQHNALNHGGNMSRAEKRQALTIPITVSDLVQGRLLGVQYRRGERQVEEDAPPPAAHPAFGTTIGGPGALRSRFGRRTAAPESDASMLASAVAASLESAREHALRSSMAEQGSVRGSREHSEGPSLDDSHFPAALGGSSLLGGSSGAPRYAVAAGASGNTIRPEDFPALAGTSKNAKKKNKERTRTMAHMLSTGNVRELLPAAPRSSRTPDLGQSLKKLLPLLPSDKFLPGPFDKRRQGILQAHSASDPSLRQTSSLASQPVARSTEAPRPQAPKQVPAKPGAAAAPAPQPQRLTAAGVLSGRTPIRPPPAPPHSAVPAPEEFPALPGTKKSVSSSQNSHSKNRNGSAASSSTPDTVSQAVRAANKELLDKIRLRLDPQAFSAFRNEGMAFSNGELTAEEFHSRIVQAGLASLVPEMATLLPDRKRQDMLLNVHRSTYLNDSAPTHDGFVPPEAVAAALQHFQDKATWGCIKCTLINGPSQDFCEACGESRACGSLGRRGTDDAGPSGLDNTSLRDDDDAESVLALTKGKGKKKKVPKFERLRLTGGDPAVTQAVLDSLDGKKPRTKPGNVWTQDHALLRASERGRATASPGVWGKPGQLASEVRSVQNAWAKK